MTAVRISYDPDLSKIGTVVEVGPAEARQLVRRGRATYAREAAPTVEPLAAVVDEAPAAVQANIAEPLEGCIEAPEGTSLDLGDDED